MNQVSEGPGGGAWVGANVPGILSYAIRFSKCLRKVSGNGRNRPKSAIRGGFGLDLTSCQILAEYDANTKKN